MNTKHRKVVKLLPVGFLAILVIVITTPSLIPGSSQLSFKSITTNILADVKGWFLEPEKRQQKDSFVVTAPIDFDARAVTLLRQAKKNEQFIEDADNAFVHVPRQLQANEQLIAKINNDLRAAQESLQLKREFDGHIQEAIASSQQQSKIEAVQLRETSYDIGQQIGQGRLPDEVLHNVERSTGISANEINELFNR